MDETYYNEAQDGGKCIKDEIKRKWKERGESERETTNVSQKTGRSHKY
jgi:hypothetical protein